MRKRLTDFWAVLKATTKEWLDIDPFRHSAVVAFYSIFSIPALLLITVTVAGFFWETEAVSGKISEQIKGMIGSEAAKLVEAIVSSSSQKEESKLMFYLGIGILLFGSTTVFYHLQKSLNRIWGVEPKPEKQWMKFIKDRLFSFGIVLSLGFLMLISLVLSSVLTAVSKWLEPHIPDVLLVLFHFINIILSLSLIAVLFALMFRFLPDGIIRWRSIWKGAIATAVLFELGKYLLSIYFGNFDPASAYGNTGAVVLILLWISYVCLIVFFGAQFTLQWAKKFGEGITLKGEASFTDNKSGI